MGYLLAPYAQFIDSTVFPVPTVEAASEFKTQIVKITIPAGDDSVDVTAPDDFVSVTESSTIALISGFSQHAKGYPTTGTNEAPDDTSVRVELIDGSTLRATRSSTISETAEVWVTLIEYIGAASGANEFIVRDRTTNAWSGGTTTDSYGPIASVSTTADVVVFSGGVENPNTSAGHFDRGHVRASIDGTKTVNLARGDGTGAIESHHQVVEFTGSNWTIQSGTSAPDVQPGGTDVVISDITSTSNGWVYYTLSTNAPQLDEIGHRVFLTTSTNLRLQERSTATGTKTIQWYVISNPNMNVEAATLDNEANVLESEITGFASAGDINRSFAWMDGWADAGGSNHPRGFWQYELETSTTINLERNRTGNTTDLAYQIIELPLGSGESIVQTHYHWRNDDGSEAAATSRTGGEEDTSINSVEEGEVLRLRLEVFNQGDATSSSKEYQLEYGRKDTNCSAISSWEVVDGASAAWDMMDSANLTNGDDTTNIAEAIGGVSDENASFKTPNGTVLDTSEISSGITLSSTEFLELEYSISPTSQVERGETYCFRLTDSGSELDSYSIYPEAQVGTERQFKVQRGEFQLTGISSTITAGVDYDAPANLENAFIRLTNTAHTGAGDDSAGGNQNVDNVSVYISNPENLLTSITFMRDADAGSNTRVNWEILEYIGLEGDFNEFIVRDQGITTFGAASLIETEAIAGISDDTKVVPFITAWMNPDNGRNDYNTGLVTTVWDDVNDEIDFERGEAGSDAVIVSWALVEFTGDKWNIQRAEHTYTAAGAIETESIEELSSTDRAFLHTQKRVGTGLQGMDEFGHEVWISDDDEISFQLQSGAGTPADQVSVAWVIENTQADQTPMVVHRISGTQAGGSEPSDITQSIGSTLGNLSNASIFGNARQNGTGTNYPRPMFGLDIADTENVGFWISDTGGTRTFRIEVVEWPIGERPPSHTIEGRVFPKNTTIAIADGLDCVPSEDITLVLGGQGVKDVWVSNNEQFTDGEWLPFSSTMPFTLSSRDGEKTLYAVFRSSTSDKSVVQTATITLDVEGQCVPPEPPTLEEISEPDVEIPPQPIDEGPETAFLPEQFCDHNCDDISFNLYAIDESGSRKELGDAFVQAEDLGDGIIFVEFEEGFERLAFLIKQVDCHHYEVRRLSADRTQNHQVGFDVLHNGSIIGATTLWSDSSRLSDSVRIVSITSLINACGEPLTNLPEEFLRIGPVKPAGQSGCVASIEFTTPLSGGDQNDRVFALQEYLQCLGFFPEEVAANGIFGPVTEASVRAFQTSRGIDALGNIGPQTRAALNL